ncbi:valine--tRNA ligase [Patescibacteria group bacterium]|nr:valine--tRNA ligase [Patescibacteria group bacterium]
MKLSKSYQPQEHEAAIYSLWESRNAFIPSQKGSPYALVMPPVNANGNLHMGHALTFSIQDIAARYQRSQGKSVLYIPGADHAGFETQVVFERELIKTGKSRFDYSREELYKNIFKFVDQNRTNLHTQIRRLGASVDWTRYTFSLDPAVVRQAYATFHSMWQQGLIYRGERLVNFCTYHGTAFADIEVIHKEEQGKLWHISYPLTEGKGSVVIATTRPETMLGDTAVAVNPLDKRYQELIGKTLRLPLTNREIPIIADSYVDPDYGTGAVKITPAHDPNDFEIGERHDLPKVTVIGFDGRLVHDVPEPFKGLTVEEGRAAIINALSKNGYLAGSEDLVHSVGHCYKCGTVIEPLLMEQWFIDMKPLAKQAITAIRAGEIKFIPDTKRKQLINYLENIRDWNISRQIAWGIPIPAFVNENDPGDWIYDERVDQEVIEVNNKTYRRDPDVFDTWFSSSSWPYVTLGFPASDNYTKFYPLELMESGFDILYQWIGRLMFQSLYVTKQVPFKRVYLHGMITDEHGRKMSKSVGNVINPMEVIDAYGSDALRIGMISGQTPGNNQPYVPSKVIGGRNFCNKLWNIARFVQDKVESDQLAKLSLADHWILNRYDTMLRAYRKLMDTYRFSEAYEEIYHFVWDDIADWYIEASKVSLNPGLVKQLLEASLILAHPFAPFVTETIWQNLDITPDSLLSGRQLLDLPKGDRRSAANFNTIIGLINQVRSMLVATGTIDVKLSYPSSSLLKEHTSLIKQLTGVSSVALGSGEVGVEIAYADLKVWLDISQDRLVAYKQRLDNQIQQELTKIARLESRLNNPQYVKRAPADLVKQSHEQLAASKQNLHQLKVKRQQLAR